MALVISCGLVTSTVLNLFLLPALYARFARARPAPTIATDGLTAAGPAA